MGDKLLRKNQESSKQTRYILRNHLRTTKSRGSLRRSNTKVVDRSADPTLRSQTNLNMTTKAMIHRILALCLLTTALSGQSLAQAEGGNSVKLTNRSDRDLTVFVTDKYHAILIRLNKIPPGAVASYTNLPADSMIRMVDEATIYGEFEVKRKSYDLEYDGRALRGFESPNTSTGGAPRVVISAVPQEAPAEATPDLLFENLTGATAHVKLYRTAKVGVWQPETFQVDPQSCYPQDLGGEIRPGDPIRYHADINHKGRDYRIDLPPGSGLKVKMTYRGLTLDDQIIPPEPLEPKQPRPELHPYAPLLGFSYRPSDDGLVVSTVDAEGLAEEAKLRSGQIIEMVNFQKVKYEYRYRALMDEAVKSGRGFVRLHLRNPGDPTNFIRDVQLPKQQNRDAAANPAPVAVPQPAPSSAPIRGMLKKD